MRKIPLAALLVLIAIFPIHATTLQNCLDCHPVLGGLPCLSAGSGGVIGTLEVLENRTYVVGYSSARMNPLWVSYRVYGVEQEGAAPTYSWRIDSRTTARVSDTDYKYTGYQRGHMAPKSAMYHCYGSDAVYDTFQLSNACPQLGELNNGPWGDLEDLVRENYSISCDEVWIIAGPIFDDTNGRAYLAKDNEHSDVGQKPVEIPDAFYKIVVDEVDGQVRALALIMDADETYGYGTGDSIPARLSGFLVSIDEIEEKTGLDFFSKLDNGTQADLESEPAQAMW
ncbi:DNA/RNA non-specific endonuclease [Candidatus Bipolaricaulota bacterium]|nr:DNA/RNA non-specific endonuclease [Candidatus Bipolaricaulota bacterium]